MAFTIGTLAGNVGAGQSTLFHYGTQDALLDVAANNYFSTEKTAYISIRQGDMIVCDASDGYSVFLVVASSKSGINTKQTMIGA